MIFEQTSIEPQPESEMDKKNPDWTICEELRLLYDDLDQALGELELRFISRVQGLHDVKKRIRKAMYRTRIATTMAKKMDGKLAEYAKANSNPQ